MLMKPSLTRETVKGLKSGFGKLCVKTFNFLIGISFSKWFTLHQLYQNEYYS